MTPERRQLAEDLFDQAVQRPTAARAAFLDTACGPDEALRAEVEALLAAYAAGAGFFDDLAGGALDLLQEPEAPDLSVADQVGPYALDELIGRGGMGLVYRAHRTDGQFEHEVAVKLMRRETLGEETLRRFRLERQILAQLQHPHIARLLDGGVTPEGVPYLVMEWIDGVPITQYCDTHRHSINQRLDLFETVCEAVKYAHANLIVHRDLKPSNILVTPEGTVKLLDFGIAKLLSPEALPFTSPMTETGLRLMTPEYASPEQVRGAPITTRTDVYQLGILLYELLTGRRPYDLPGRLRHEIGRAILEEEPTRPSTAITSATGRTDGTTPTRSAASVRTAFSTSLDRLKRQLRGDLDNIVLMALRKEPDRRYQSVGQLAEDIRLHQAGFPVTAQHDSLAYRASKFLRRHRLSLGMTALVVMGLLTGLGVALWQAQVARLERAKAEQVATFLTDLFQSNNPWESQGETLTARAVLDRGTARIARELRTQPELQGRMYAILGVIYANLDAYTQADSLLRKALALQDSLWDRPHPETAKTLDALVLLHRADRPGTAIALGQRAVAAKTTLYGPSHPERAAALTSLGFAYHGNNNLAQADSVFALATSIYKRHAETDPAAYALHVCDVRAMAWSVQDTLRTAEIAEALETLETHYGPDRPEVVTCKSNLGWMYREAGNYPEAQRIYAEMESTVGQVYGTQSSIYADVLSGLYRVASLRKDYPTALAYIDQLMATFPRAPGNIPRMHDELARADLHMKLGNLAEAEAGVDQVVTLQRSLTDLHPAFLANSLEFKAEVHYQQGAYTAGLTAAEEALAIRQQAGSVPWRLAYTDVMRGSNLIGLGRFEAAEALLRPAHDLLAQARGPHQPRTETARQRLVALYEAWHQPEKADAYR